MKPKASSQVVIISDTHVGSTLGLCPPSFSLDDGGSYRSNTLQGYAWDFWTEKFWPEVHERAKTRDTVVVLNGDLVDGNHHGTSQIFTTDPIQQINLAVEIFAPIASRYPIYVTRGTAAHVMAAGAADEKIAKELGAKSPSKARSVKSAYHLKLEVGGVLLDIAHHGPPAGGRIHTHGNALRSFARDIVLQAKIAKAQAPDVIVRSHVHHYTYEIGNDYDHICHSIITPAWQWKTEFAHKVVSHEDVADVGGVIVSVDGGHVSGVTVLRLPISNSDTVRHS